MSYLCFVLKGKDASRISEFFWRSVSRHRLNLKEAGLKCQENIHVGGGIWTRVSSLAISCSTIELLNQLLVGHSIVAYVAQPINWYKNMWRKKCFPPQFEFELGWHEKSKKVYALSGNWTRDFNFDIPCFTNWAIGSLVDLCSLLKSHIDEYECMYSYSSLYPSLYLS